MELEDGGGRSIDGKYGWPDVSVGHGGGICRLQLQVICDLSSSLSGLHTNLTLTISTITTTLDHFRDVLRASHHPSAGCIQESERLRSPHARNRTAVTTSHLIASHRIRHHKTECRHTELNGGLNCSRARTITLQRRVLSHSGTKEDKKTRRKQGRKCRL